MANSHCKNTIGFVNGNKGYDCACNSGYSGDGLVECTDINECDSNPCAGCSIDCSQCTNLPGSFTCQCLDGFAGDGFSQSFKNVKNSKFLKFLSNLKNVTNFPENGKSFLKVRNSGISAEMKLKKRNLFKILNIL